MSTDQNADIGTDAFEVQIEPAREAVRLHPQGELDLATAPALKQQVIELVEVGFDHLVIDLRGLSFIDSTGIAMLVWLTEQSQAAEWTLSMIQGRGQVDRILQISGTAERLPFAQAA